jgi:hypothetical protein
MKRPNLRPSTKAFAIALAAVGASLTACQGLVASAPLTERLAPLDLALRETPQALEPKATRGDGEAQLALVVVETSGLYGRRPDPVAANHWLALAQANRRFMPITQYTAAFNGQPSRVNIVNVPVQAVTPGQVEAIKACASLLTGLAAPSDSCGSEEELAARRTAWRRAGGR